MIKRGINFLKSNVQEKMSDPTKKAAFLRSIFYPTIFLGIFVLVFSFQVLLSGENLQNNVQKSVKKFSFLNAIGLSKDNPLKGEDEDRINIMLLGMGGLGHQGPFLTDTIIIASIRPSTKDVSMLSIPRDLSVPITGYGWRKINSVNHYGELNNPGQGAQYTADYLSKLLDIPIHYYMRVDFSGFEKLIDDLGGIDVYVSNSFSDNQFPDDNFGYQPVSFEKGWAEMDGKTALNFARSRHGNNGEGSDFARSQRQQKVIKAVKDKILSANTLLNPLKLSSLYEAYQSMVSTNVTLDEAAPFVKLAKEIDDEKVQTLVLDESQSGLIYATKINGAYLLLPRDESFYELQLVAKNIFEPQNFLKPHERATVEIRNGTKINGLAYQSSVKLTRRGFEVSKIGNAVNQEYEKTVIYDLTKGQKQIALEKLVHEIKANVAPEIPDWLTNQSSDTENQNPDPGTNADFLIILGTDQQSLTQNE